MSKFVQPVVKHHAFWVENQNLKKQKRRRKKHKKKVSSVKLGRNKDEGTLSEEHYVQEEDTADPFFDDIADKDAAVTPDLERKSDETEEVNIERKKLLMSFKPIRQFSFSYGVENNLKLLGGKGALVAISQDRDEELLTKFKHLLKTPSKTLFQWIPEKEREMLKERDAKRLLRKRKATIAEEQPSKKPKLRTETIDELRNYLRVVDFEKNAQDRESLEGISMITELQVIDSPDGRLTSPEQTATVHHGLLPFLDGASCSREVDTGEPVGSVGLQAIAARTREITLSGGLNNSSNIGWNKIS
ncbi:hypothetical protein Tco_0405019 [Tanacetum coccineum]